MKILTADQIREADRYTIKNEPVKSEDLMERAGKKCFDWIYENAPGFFPEVKEESNWVFNIVCGVGNNGGDGLVIARHLLKNGYEVNIFIVHFSDKPSADFVLNENKLGKHRKKVTDIKSIRDIPVFDPSQVVIDCLFGTGLSRPAEGLAAGVIQNINTANPLVISIDMPSGLFSEDNSDNAPNGIIHSDYILTFQVPKLSFFLPENEPFLGEVVVLDIGLHPDFMEQVEAAYHLVTHNVAASLLRSRSRFSHKGTFGTALIIAGSLGSIGAAIMSTRSAYRSGAGMVMAFVPKCGLLPMQMANPEAMAETGSQEFYLDHFPEKLDKYSAIGVGPGMGTHPDTAKALKFLLQNCKVPLVLDADALNILSENKTWLAFLPANTVLTPHPGEFRRLVGDWTNDREKLQKQKEFCQKFGCYLILKGNYSSICFPDGKIMFNSTGNSGMATGGSGDVLTGLLTGLLASGYAAAHAVVLGAYLHGLAGDIAAKDLSPESMLATDIIDKFAAAFKQLQQKL